MKKNSFLYLSLIVFTCLLIYIIQKAINYPITHDEAGTIFQYVDFKEYTLWNIMFWYHPLGNNHILNTLLTKLSIEIFGMKIWSLRLPNILSFCIFFYYVYQIVKSQFTNNYLRLAAILLLCCHPFMLDFFALCRGYGMSIAFFMGMIYYLFSFITSKSLKDQVYAMLMGCLASYANFTMLNVFVCVYAILMFLNSYHIYKKQLQQKKHIVLSTCILILFFALIIVPIIHLKNAGEFQWGGADNFYYSTIFNVLQNDIYDHYVFKGKTVQTYVYVLIILIFIPFLIQSIQLLLNRKISQKVYFFSGVLLCLTIVSSILQHQFLGSAYLTNRTAIQFIPLLFVPAVLGFYWIEKLPKFSIIFISFCISVITIYHVYKTYNTTCPREWWYELHNKEVIALIEKENLQQPGKVKLGCFWHFAPSINIYITRFGHDKIAYVPPYEELRSTADFDYYYIYYSDTSKLNKAYKKHAFYSNMVLMKKEK